MKLLVLKKGMNCDEVGNWQAFLRGLGIYLGQIDNDFGNATEAATKAFQAKNKINPADGVVGTVTYGKAMALGFSVGLEDDENDIYSENYPPKPKFQPLVSNTERARLFGSFEFVPAPTKTNPEGIRILGDWASKNIVRVPLPALSKATGGKFGAMQWHKSAEGQLRKFFETLEKENLHTHILSFAGAYFPRFVRGSRSALSNHSWGTAFDINVPQNGLNKRPALVGQKGCVRELVPIAHEFGFYWGGHFSRPDGMHFEIAKIL